MHFYLCIIGIFIFIFLDDSDNDIGNALIVDCICAFDLFLPSSLFDNIYIAVDGNAIVFDDVAN